MSINLTNKNTNIYKAQELFYLYNEIKIELLIDIINSTNFRLTRGDGSYLEKTESED